jgi:hypothetical protein
MSYTTFTSFSEMQKLNKTKIERKMKQWEMNPLYPLRYRVVIFTRYLKVGGEFVPASWRPLRYLRLSLGYRVLF